jgi:preprotein translocase subunit YajC
MTLHFLADALASTPATPSSDEQLYSSLFMFAMIFVVFYFLIIRPQSKKYKQHLAMISAIKRNDTVITAGGIVGKVTKVSDNGELLVEIAKGVEVSVISSTVSSVTDHKSKATNDNNN